MFLSVRLHSTSIYAFSLSQIQQFKVNPMVKQDHKWFPQDSGWLTDLQFSVYFDYAEFSGNETTSL